MNISQIRFGAMDPNNQVKEYFIVFDTEEEAQEIVNLLEILKLQSRKEGYKKQREIWFDWCLENMDTLRASVNPVGLELFDKVIRGIRDIQKLIENNEK